MIKRMVIIWQNTAEHGMKNSTIGISKKAEVKERNLSTNLRL